MMQQGEIGQENREKDSVLEPLSALCEHNGDKGM